MLVWLQTVWCSSQTVTHRPPFGSNTLSGCDVS